MYGQKNKTSYKVTYVIKEINKINTSEPMDSIVSIKFHCSSGVWQPFDCQWSYEVLELQGKTTDTQLSQCHMPCFTVSTLSLLVSSHSLSISLITPTLFYSVHLSFPIPPHTLFDTLLPSSAASPSTLLLFATFACICPTATTFPAVCFLIHLFTFSISFPFFSLPVVFLKLTGEYAFTSFTNTSKLIFYMEVELIQCARS